MRSLGFTTLVALVALLLLGVALIQSPAFAQEEDPIPEGVNAIDKNSPEFLAHMAKFPPLRRLSDKSVKKWIKSTGPSDTAVLLLTATKEICGDLCEVREHMVIQLQVPGAAYRVAAINVPKYNVTMTELAQASPFFGPLTHQKLMIPSVMIFREGVGRPFFIDWENPQKFVDYLQRFTQTAYLKLEDDNDEIEFNRLLSSARIVAHFDKNDPNHAEQLETYKRLTNVLQQEMNFFYTFSDKMGARYAPGKTPSLSFYPHFAKSASQFTGKFSFENILSYVHKSYRRTLINMAPGWQMSFLIKDLKPTLVAFWDSGADARRRVNLEKLFNAIIHARKINKHTDDFDTGVVDVQNYRPFAQGLGVDLDDLPRLVLVHKDLTRIYNYDGPLGGPSISQFVDDFFDHKLKPSTRSAPLPEDQDEDGARELVRNNYVKVVMNNDKDVIVHLHSDTCMECQQFKRVWNQVAKHYKNDANVEIAHMNLSHNDLPPDTDIEKLPAVLMYPAYLDPEAEFEPKQYYGETHTLDDMVSFIERNRKTKFAKRPKEEL